MKKGEKRVSKTEPGQTGWSTGRERERDKKGEKKNVLGILSSAQFPSQLRPKLLHLI